MVIETKHRQRITAGACGLLTGLLPASASGSLLSMSLMLVALIRTLLHILAGLAPVLPMLLSVLPMSVLLLSVLLLSVLLLPVLLMSVLLLSVLLVRVSVLSLMAMLLMRAPLVRLPLAALLMMLTMLLMLAMVQKRLLLGHRLGISKMA